MKSTGTRTPTQAKRYRSLTGHDYSSAQTGKHMRVEAFEECVEIPDYAVQTELRAGKIEEIGGSDG